MVKKVTVANTMPQEDFYKLVFDSIEDYAVLVTDSSGTITSCNPGGERLFGYKQKEIVGQSAAILFTEKDKKQNKHVKELETAAKKGRAVDERWHLKKDGSKFWCSGLVFPIKDKSGKLCGFTKVARDLTDQVMAKKHADEELKTKTALLESMVEGVSLSDESGVIIYTNPAEDRIFGYNPGELIGQHVSVQNTYEPKENSLIVKQVIEQLKKKGVWHGEFANKKKDGTPFTTSAHITALELGGKSHWMCVQEDITERKLAQENLNFRTALLEAQNDVTPDGILVVDTKGKMLTYNKRFGTMWNMPQEIMDAHDDDAALKFAMTQLVKPQEFIDRVIYLYKHPNEVSQEEVMFKDGRILERFGAPVKDSDGRRYGWAWQFHDITRRKKSEQKLQDSEEQFKKLADSMPQIVWTAQPDGYLDYYNKQWYQYTGFKESYGDQSWVPILHPDDVEPCISTWHESVKTGQPYQIEYRFKDPDNPGAYRWFLGRALPIKNENGKIIKWFGTCTDIDDVKRTRKRKDELEIITVSLTKQRKQLMELNHAKDEFISIASHQLRTPATGVKQYIAMTLEGYAGKLNPQQTAFLQQAYESNERQINIVNDLLRVAKIDAGKVVLDKQKTDMVALIENVINEQGSKIKDRQQKAIFTHTHKVLHTKIDAHKIRMVVENILDNASKYTPPKRDIEVKISKTKGVIHIAVKDQGVGLRKRDTDKIFNKFTRIDNPMSVSEGGTGLGLYWAKKIMDLHKGSIDVESALGKGSVFTITIPA